MIWFTADLHFGHKSIIKYQDTRPFTSVEEMDAALICNLQDRVVPKDTLYVLGDFSFYKPDRTSELLSQIPGTKILIKGNHDHSKQVKKVTGWADVRDYLELRVPTYAGKQLIVMCHFPFLTWNKAHYGSWHLHGHSHGSLQADNNCRLDVGVDCHDLYPISFDSVTEILRCRGFTPVDHHKMEGS